METRYGWGVCAVSTLIFALITLDPLPEYPPVTPDEPWIASAPYKLATEGIFGSDLFAGWSGSERHDYQQMPLYELLQAGIFRIFGVGVLQARGPSVVFGLLLVPLVFLVGRRLGGEPVGMTAVGLLLLLAVSSVEGRTGIPLLDASCIGRYDVAVPVFGLLAYLALTSAESRANPLLYLAAGAVVGLAFLNHVYGAFWLPALAGVLIARRGWRSLRQPPPYLLLAGFVLVLVPWAVYVARGWTDFVGQMRYTADRQALWDPQFYLHNAVTEIARYRMDLLGPTGAPAWRPGAWIVLAGVPVALLGLLREWESGPDRPAVAFGVVLGVQLVLFTTVLVPNHTYLIGLWPLECLALGWLVVRLGRRLTHWAPRTCLIAVMAVIALQGATRISQRHAAAAGATAYDVFTFRVAARIPAGSRVLGPARFWLGLRQFDYRAWLLPIILSDPRLVDHPVPLPDALARIAPDCLLIDSDFRRHLDAALDPSHPHHRHALGWAEYRRRHGLWLVDTVSDSTYGTMEIYSARSHLSPLRQPLNRVGDLPPVLEHRLRVTREVRLVDHDLFGNLQ